MALSDLVDILIGVLKLTSKVSNQWIVQLITSCISKASVRTFLYRLVAWLVDQMVDGRFEIVTFFLCICSAHNLRIEAD